MIAVRNQDGVAGADLLEHLDRAIGRAVHAVEPKPRDPSAKFVVAGSDLEVVDLL